jgi:Family of unknown function (DUF5694)
MRRLGTTLAATFPAVAAAILLSLRATPGPAQAPPAPTAARPEILILGTYHMANPGRDIHNMKADDVLSAKRQREIEELVDVLQRFHPTKIAVEASIGSERIPDRYAAYRAGQYQLTQNEIDQIGLRLAKALGHETVYPVDEGGEFPYYRVLNYAKANGLKARFDSIEAVMGASVDRQGAFLGTHTVLEVLQYLNADSTAARDVAGYYAFVPFGDPNDYAGPDLVARWFERNIRIYRNIRALVTSPDDRILVIYGAGHLGWLRQDVRNDATVELRTLADLVQASH